MTLRTRSDINVAYFDTWPFSPRFEQRGPDECWPWLRAVGNHGYGITYDGVASRLAHRVAWTLHHQRQIPEGDTVDHFCHVRTCVNPAHLRLLSNVDNATDNGQRSKTHCPKGHLYDEANTVIDSKGYRKCRACGVEFNRIQHAKKAAKVRAEPSPLQCQALEALGVGEWKTSLQCGGGVAIGQALRQLARKNIIDRRDGPEYRGRKF